MEDYKQRRLTSHDEAELYFIAKLHEKLPAGWIDDYQGSEETIQNTTKELVAKHQHQHVYCSIIEHQNKVISYIWAELNESNSKQVDIISLWTDEAYRGQGHAKQLKIALETWAKEDMHAEKIHTTVSSKNTNMVKLNEKLGYHTAYYRMIKPL
ncbi:GNAT family N-acetyltransferase [Lentibacillus saliphilus]|uniref:GNAT family N-acetyltransferase n=1 Tax=Lentibacillus saliphilus TaxID=2737028 RepID=UPI001C2F4D4A|nr:GNAT family N-acetyltransferase [Lentibacillus saliphilus]